MRKHTIFSAVENARRAIGECCQNSGRDSADIAIIAAAKTFCADDVRVCAECGIVDIGENYLQEAQDKMRQVASLPLIWHYIGRLQSNKAAAVARLFDFVHSVDNADIAAKLSAARAEVGKPLAVFVQVNIDFERGKGGIAPKDAAALARDIAALPNLILAGLMCMPNPAGDAGLAFGTLRRLRDSINASEKLQMRGLSMGMSGDYQQAITEGATHLRLGTAIFGARPKPAPRRRIRHTLQTVCWNKVLGRQCGDITRQCRRIFWRDTALAALKVNINLHKYRQRFADFGAGGG